MTADSAITELDDRTVERIAAGEVVERPASVVKELLENAIDADANRVEVAVEAGGTERIEVRDDGRGMTEADLRRAVREHTTSKIDDVEDLEAGVGTLGFRGEALHAIGAVSRTTITSSPRDQPQDQPKSEATGTDLSLAGGEVTNVSPAGRPPGTTVSVTDLFYNVPARRKYLKTETTEFGHINRVVASYALANPGVAITLVHDDREIFATTGTGDRQAAVMAVYGREVAASMVPVDPGDLPDGPLEGVTGLVSHPETNRASRDYLSTFVNGRYVTAGAVREAILDAYGTQLGPDRYPFAVLDIDLDPGTVDVNVHPRKLDVRFAEESALKDQVEAAVHAALSREGLARTRAPRGRSAPDEAPVAPESPSDASGEEGPTSGSAVTPDASDSESSVGGSGSSVESPTSSPASPRAESESPAGSDSASPAGSDSASP
ncbi:MAG: DNA mismatch repair endonuclease MutL, partial [Haloarculaceae archaeon]